MMGDWVAAAVRARAFARGRLGRQGARAIAHESDLASARLLLRGTSFASLSLGADRTASQLEREVEEAVLWQLRVLAGWLPPGGSPVLRACAAWWERDNILTLARHLEQGTDRDADGGSYELGGLATAWDRISGSTTARDLRAQLAASPWGDSGEVSRAGLAADLDLVAWRRLATVAPSTVPWARRAAAVTVARELFTDGSAEGRASDRLAMLAIPLLGTDWQQSKNLAAYIDAVGPRVAQIFDGISEVSDLWRADARLAARMETDAARLVRQPTPGPDVVVGSAMLLILDGRRLRVALAAAEDPTERGELFDAVA